MPTLRGFTGVILSSDETEIEFISKEIEGEILIPDGIKKLEVGVFDKCKGLTGIRISKSVLHIDGNVFAECCGLVHIKVDEGNPVYKSADDKMLLDKSGTELVFVPRGVKGELHVPKEVKSIQDGAFKDCTSLKTIYFEGDAPNLGLDVFKNVQATVYYRKETKGWGKTFGGLYTKEISGTLGQ